MTRRTKNTAACPDCLNEVALKKDGFLYVHGYSHGCSPDTICDGSGKPPMRRKSVTQRTGVVRVKGDVATPFTPPRAGSDSLEGWALDAHDARQAKREEAPPMPDAACHTPGATAYCPVCRTDFTCPSCLHAWDTTEQRKACMRSHVSPCPRPNCGSDHGMEGAVAAWDALVGGGESHDA